MTAFQPGTEASVETVLDLSDELSSYGTKLLASLGAQVTRVSGPDVDWAGLRRGGRNVFGGDAAAYASGRPGYPPGGLPG